MYTVNDAVIVVQMYVCIYVFMHCCYGSCYSENDVEGCRRCPRHQLAMYEWPCDLVLFVYSPGRLVNLY